MDNIQSLWYVMICDRLGSHVRAKIIMENNLKVCLMQIFLSV